MPSGEGSSAPPLGISRGQGSEEEVWDTRWDLEPCDSTRGIVVHVYARSIDRIDRGARRLADDHAAAGLGRECWR